MPALHVINFLKLMLKIFKYLKSKNQDISSLFLFFIEGAGLVRTGHHAVATATAKRLQYSAI